MLLNTDLKASSYTHSDTTITASILAQKANIHNMSQEALTTYIDVVFDMDTIPTDIINEINMAIAVIDSKDNNLNNIADSPPVKPLYVAPLQRRIVKLDSDNKTTLPKLEIKPLEDIRVIVPMQQFQQSPLVRDLQERERKIERAAIKDIIKQEVKVNSLTQIAVKLNEQKQKETIKSRYLKPIENVTFMESFPIKKHDLKGNKAEHTTINELRAAQNNIILKTFQTNAVVLKANNSSSSNNKHLAIAIFNSEQKISLPVPQYKTKSLPTRQLLINEIGKEITPIKKMIQPLGNINKLHFFDSNEIVLKAENNNVQAPIHELSIPLPPSPILQAFETNTTYLKTSSFTNEVPLAELNSKKIILAKKQQKLKSFSIKDLFIIETPTKINPIYELSIPLSRSPILQELETNTTYLKTSSFTNEVPLAKLNSKKIVSAKKQQKLKSFSIENFFIIEKRMKIAPIKTLTNQALSKLSLKKFATNKIQITTRSHIDIPQLNPIESKNNVLSNIFKSENGEINGAFSLFSSNDTVPQPPLIAVKKTHPIFLNTEDVPPYKDTSIVQIPSSSHYTTWETNKLFPIEDRLKMKKDTSITLTVLGNEHCEYTHPIDGPITSKFGWRDSSMHSGIDIDLVRGDKVATAFDGMVRLGRTFGGYGKVIIVRHYNGLETVYAHLSRILVKPGQLVASGDIIGLGGNTGHSTGSHLHFEVRYKGIAINPKYLISLSEQQLMCEQYTLKKTKYGLAVFPKDTKQYTVVRGDNVYEIARRFGTSTTSIKELNQLSSTWGRIKVGTLISVK